MRAYAAASSTTASYTAILNAATAGLTDKPARSTTENYRDLLSQIRVLDPVPAWTAALTPMPHLKRLNEPHPALSPISSRIATPIPVCGPLLYSGRCHSSRVPHQTTGSVSFCR